MRRIAVIITVFNRIEKTVKCLDALFAASDRSGAVDVDVYLTDDGSSDGTSGIVGQRYVSRNITILHGDGNLYWNGGMINSWSEAVKRGGYDGYLWLNNDTTLLPNIFEELTAADEYSVKHYGRRGIYVGSTKDAATGEFSYGGFDYVSKITLKDRFHIPNGEFQACQCGHGNATYVSQEVVDALGLLHGGYRHSVGDHDYTYQAFRHRFPVIVLREYVGECTNDHRQSGPGTIFEMSLRDRLRSLKNPLRSTLHNTLLFNRRNFPWRYPFVAVTSYAKVLCPNLYFKLYYLCRR